MLGRQNAARGERKRFSYNDGALFDESATEWSEQVSLAHARGPLG